MGSVTCERCGFVSFATSEVCKQCGGPLPGPAAIHNWRPQPQPAWQQQAAADWQQQQQQSYAGNWPPPPAQNWPPPPHGSSGYYQSQPGHYGADDGRPKRKGMAVVAMLCGLFALPVMIAGLIISISLDGGWAGMAGALLGLLMTILALTLGIAATVKVNKNPAEFGGKGMAITGIILGCLLLCSTLPIGIIASIAIPNLLAARKASNEAAAIGTLRQLSAAQSTYLATAGGNQSYGTMDELATSGLIDGHLAAGTKSGYRFEIEVSDGSFVATATPVTYPQTGRRSFCVSEDGVIRGADKSGQAADTDDPEVTSGGYSEEPLAADGEDVEWTENGPVIRRTNSQVRGRR